ncbi:MAG: tRNA (guanosine(37)-N1)-methyltransferase TrmD [Candidatus Omnitrophica bacterium]|nr:tRNA (guanosine(37)-N1)-methyltransferase TrmD [Candidatus Omnitrophota bacterium]MCF7892134.1 tRNA (guanosine(37)-N1)-methyltransferase TrmD [Candidatus Omnitrophota bacterium]MCF7897495.1 tRNA (guanosine(37)-N1)-methyltransferase TrmD [Candidatus Omnitrophota bacterium]MCF7909276.1 tRNA (guanosine(37)-N1)-methyltransferase TrmD [Candidatus Omnitrophota bacterium]
MIIDIITIFPEMFYPVLGESIIKRAQEKGLVKINIHNLRDYSDDSNRRIDAPSYGGGGMVFKPGPVFKAVETILGRDADSKGKGPGRLRKILFTPKGKTLTQNKISNFLDFQRLVLIAPRYEGVDQRVHDFLIDEEISVGDYVLSGGELPAMVFADSLIRLIPGVVSDRESVKQESFQKNCLDFPHYTRPENFKGLKVPEVLLSGNHKKIEEWRKAQANKITRKQRPDLLK